MARKRTPFDFSNVTSASDLRNTESVTPGTEDATARSPRSALGGLAKRTAKATVEELQRLREQIQVLETERDQARNQGDEAFFVPLEKIVLPAEYNRDALAYSDEAFQSLVESIRTREQDTPAKVLPLDDGRYLLTAGVRRYHACRVLDRPLWVLVSKHANSDRDRALEKWAENEERLDWAPLERARLFRDWLDQGVFPSQRTLAESIGKPDSYVSRHLSLLDIPDAILQIFTDSRVVSIKQGVILARACARSQEDADTLCAFAESLSEREGLSDEQRLSALSKRAHALLSGDSQSESPRRDDQQAPVEIKTVRGRRVLQFRSDVPDSLIDDIVSWVQTRLETEL